MRKIGKLLFATAIWTVLYVGVVAFLIWENPFSTISEWHEAARLSFLMFWVIGPLMSSLAIWDVDV